MASIKINYRYTLTRATSYRPAAGPDSWTAGAPGTGTLGIDDVVAAVGRRRASCGVGPECSVCWDVRNTECASGSGDLYVGFDGAEVGAAGKVFWFSRRPSNARETTEELRNESAILTLAEHEVLAGFVIDPVAPPEPEPEPEPEPPQPEPEPPVEPPLTFLEWLFSSPWGYVAVVAMLGFCLWLGSNALQVFRQRKYLDRPAKIRPTRSGAPDRNWTGHETSTRPNNTPFGAPPPPPPPPPPGTPRSTSLRVPTSLSSSHPQTRQSCVCWTNRAEHRQ